MNQRTVSLRDQTPPTVTPVQGQPSRLHQTSAKEYGLRFLFGGIATAAVGIIATVFGPEVAGLFLAFPAILIASLTLLGNHHGNAAAGSDALGAAFGAVGLLAFGAIIWSLSQHVPGVLTLALATVLWFIVSVVIWLVFDASRRRRKD
jgi:uncharacterized membrane protein (GlpM family)